MEKCLKCNGELFDHLLRRKYPVSSANAPKLNFEILINDDVADVERGLSH